MLSKNLFKANQFILREKEPVVLDSNELLLKKLGNVLPSLGEERPAGFQSGLDAPLIDPILLENPDASVEEAAQSLVVSGPSPEELLAEAREEIAEMQKAAREEIEASKAQAMEEGRSQGYEEGRQQAMAEWEEKTQALSAEKEAMELEYQKLIQELEPKFIETLTGIYEEIFKVDLKDYKGILHNAIANTISQTEGSRDFLVHISKADYDTVMEQKEELMSLLPSQSVTVELIADASLHENECMIETGSGIYDCGIGPQLEELTRKLRLLSYEG